jgi:hypothetical protein
MTLNEFFDEWGRWGDSTRCFYCGVVMLVGAHIYELHPHLRTKDHFVPKSRKALRASLPLSLHNVALTVKSCATCNSIKGNRTPEALRTHVKKMNNGSDVFLCESILNTSLRSMPEYLAYCEAAMQQYRQEKIALTKRSMEAIKERRALGLLPPANHKNTRRKAMQENVWWNAMNACGKLIFALHLHGDHPEVVVHLRETIALIKSTMPEEFARRKLEMKDEVKET